MNNVDHQQQQQHQPMHLISSNQNDNPNPAASTNTVSYRDYNTSKSTIKSKQIPDLVIPSFETTKTSSSGTLPLASQDENNNHNNSNNAMQNAIISPDSIQSATKTNATLTFSQYRNDEDDDQENGASSPTNPSAPLTSPSKKSLLATVTSNPSQSSTSSPPPLPQPPSQPFLTLRKVESISSTGNHNNNNAFLNRINGPPPAPMAQRGRVVSLDRRPYMNDTDDDDDDDLSNDESELKERDEEDDGEDEDDISSYGSSDGEGSYFSEHLPSPPMGRRPSIGSYSNPRLLPPGSTTNNNNNNSNNAIHTSNGITATATRSRNNLHMPSLYSSSSKRQYSMSHESDLSLSSSSSEEEIIAATKIPSKSKSTTKNHLERTYDFQRTRSLPLQGVSGSRTGSSLRSSHRNPISEHRTPNPTTTNTTKNSSQQHKKSNSAERKHEETSFLGDNTILFDHRTKISASFDDEEHLNMPLPQKIGRFPSTSSLVSSSSEDVERLSNSHDANIGGGGGGRHRRQNSYRSVGSITSAGSAYLPEKVKRGSSNEAVGGGNGGQSELDNEHSKPPEHVSFSPGGGGTGSFVNKHNSNNNKHSKSSSKRSSSSDQRVPKHKSYHDTQKNQPISVLSLDQMNAWRSGGGVSGSGSGSGSYTRNDSYVSSNGNTSGVEKSPDRKNFHESASLSNGSKQSTYLSRSGSGIFIYSEDDTDESVKYRDMMKNVDKHTMNDEEDSASRSFISERPSHVKKDRSFGKDLTNAIDTKPSRQNSQINPSPERRNGMHSNPSGVAANNPYDSGRIMNGHEMNVNNECSSLGSSKHFKVYWKRWLMLLYIALLNLLSDWTCFSVAPIALLTAQSFQDINPEHLVTIFLFANTISTATEPILLARLGLRRTIVFGAFLLMFGNAIKSGGIPGIIGQGLQEGDNAWRLYTGFFLVGLSQPLYQCTPSILSSSWFPEKERTLATGIALNSNQLGIGCSFVFGSILVGTSDDIPSYFGLLSLLSTFVFVGCYLQFQDAPPTPPSDTARVIRGNTVFPYMNFQQPALPQYLKRFQGSYNYEQIDHFHNQNKNQRRIRHGSAGSSESKSSNNKGNETNVVESRPTRRTKRSERRNRDSPNHAFRPATRNRSRRVSADNNGRSSTRRQKSSGSKSIKSESTSRRRNESHGLAPSPASGSDPTETAISTISMIEHEAQRYGSIAPSPMMPGRVGRRSRRDRESTDYDTPQRNSNYANHQSWQRIPYGQTTEVPHHPYPAHTYGQQEAEQFAIDHSDNFPETPFPNLRYTNTPMTASYTNQMHVAPPYDTRETPAQYYNPMDDPRYLYNYPPPHHQVPPDYYQYQQSMPPPYYHYPGVAMNPQQRLNLPMREGPDDGVEPVLTHAGPNLSIDIRDDQIIRSVKACFARPGFVQCVIAFAVSGTVLNTISTYIDSLLRLTGAGRGTVGVIGGSFQALVMISSLIVGRLTDKKRAYYCVVIGLLVLGAFTLAECAINLEAERGNSLGFTLLLLALFVGPLQPVATELGCEV